MFSDSPFSFNFVFAINGANATLSIMLSKREILAMIKGMQMEIPLRSIVLRVLLDLRESNILRQPRSILLPLRIQVELFFS